MRLLILLPARGIRAECRQPGIPNTGSTATPLSGLSRPSTKTAGLDLSTREGALKGGVSGAALKPGSANESLLFSRVLKGQMPPAGPLAPEERQLLQQWIDSGAPWTRTVTEQRAGLDWWSLQPLATYSPPAVTGAPPLWTQSPIDRWIFSRLQQEGLQPSSPADRRALIRRLSFDLTGLPPTPEDIDGFIADQRADAYEHLVDRLLSSPGYGERWARHWLDVVRFSESEGFERDWLRDHAWPYRDYVIRSFNQDKPYTQFAKEQIAGDVLAPVTRDGIAATGLLVLGPFDAVGLTSAVARQRAMVREDQLEEMLGVVSQTFLGLTVNCARCHDHKFDPIPQKDYYRLKAVFDGVWQPVEGEELKADGRVLLTPREQQDLNALVNSLEARTSRLEAALGDLDRTARRSLKTSLLPERPFAAWSFETDTRDDTDSLHLQANNDTEVADGRLRPLSVRRRGPSDPHRYRSTSEKRHSKPGYTSARFLKSRRLF